MGVYKKDRTGEKKWGENKENALIGGTESHWGSPERHRTSSRMSCNSCDKARSLVVHAYLLLGSWGMPLLVQQIYIAIKTMLVTPSHGDSDWCFSLTISLRPDWHSIFVPVYVYETFHKFSLALRWAEKHICMLHVRTNEKRLLFMQYLNFFFLIAE